jgi:hypothetical protein
MRPSSEPARTSQVFSQTVAGGQTVVSRFSIIHGKGKWSHNAGPKPRLRIASAIPLEKPPQQSVPGRSMPKRPDNVIEIRPSKIDLMARAVRVSFPQFTIEEAREIVTETAFRAIQIHFQNHPPASIPAEEEKCACRHWPAFWDPWTHNAREIHPNAGIDTRSAEAP